MTLARWLVVALCLVFALPGVLAAQEQSEEAEDIDPLSPIWRLGSPEERQLARYHELQDQWAQRNRPQSEEEETPPRQQARATPGTVSLSLLSAPKSAKKAYQRALSELKKKEPNLDKAKMDLDKAVHEHPSMAPAWELLGWISTYKGKRIEARSMFLKSVEADSRYQSGHIALARTAADRLRWEEAVQWSERAVKLDPSTSRAHFYWAVASFHLDDLDAAAREARNALDSPDPFLPAFSHQILGAIYHRRNDLRAAAHEYRIFLKAEPHHPLAEQLAKHVAGWEAAGLIAVASGRKQQL